MEHVAGTGRLLELPYAECLDRLRAATIGRVAWNTVDGPQVRPVTFALVGRQVVFRTGFDGGLAELRDPRPVVFEADDYDTASRSGWSVLVRGQARAAARPEELADLWAQEGPVPWVGGRRNLFIVISPDAISGRQVRP